MYFTTDAVPAEQFEQWVAATRNTGTALNAQSYIDLAKPSKAVLPFTYRDVAPDLFSHILSSATAAYPASQRAEK
jgi:cytochrome o ubiquinol oxidase subunit II